MLAVLQAIASALTLFLIYQSVMLSWGRKIATYTLIIGALHLPWIMLTGYALPETFYTLLLAALLYLGLKVIQEGKLIHNISWGLVFIAAFWIKGQHVFLFPLFLLGLWIKDKKSFWKKSSVISFMVFFGLLVHGLLTSNTTGKFQLSASTGGLNLVEGKCESKKNTDSRGMTFYSPLYYHLHLNQHKKWNRPFTDSKYFIQQGIKCMQKNPWVIIQSLENIPYLFFGNLLWPLDWSPFAKAMRLYELAFTLFILPGLFAFGLSQSRKGIQDLIIWVFPVLALFVLVFIFKSEIRYRIPFDVFLVPMGMKGWVILAHSIQRIKEDATLNGLATFEEDSFSQ